MDIRHALKSQYHAALATLGSAIVKCPDALWDDASTDQSVVWRVAYHTLYFTDLYLCQKVEDFVPWAKHRDEAHVIRTVPWEGNRPPKPCDPYTREDILEYLQLCDEMVARVDSLDLSAAESGFSWYKMSKIEHQIVNIRHIQHHAAALSYRLRTLAGMEIGWVSAG